MQYLNKEIEKLAKNKAGNSLVNKKISCGIFQEMGETPMFMNESQRK